MNKNLLENLARKFVNAFQQNNPRGLFSILDLLKQDVEAGLSSADSEEREREIETTLRGYRTFRYKCFSFSMQPASDGRCISMCTTSYPVASALFVYGQVRHKKRFDNLFREAASLLEVSSDNNYYLNDFTEEVEINRLLSPFSDRAYFSLKDSPVGNKYRFGLSLVGNADNAYGLLSVLHFWSPPYIEREFKRRLNSHLAGLIVENNAGLVRLRKRLSALCPDKQEQIPG